MGNSSSSDNVQEPQPDYADEEEEDRASLAGIKINDESEHKDASLAQDQGGEELTTIERREELEQPGDEDLFQSRELVLAIVGKAGSGKSATGNAILQADSFEAAACCVSITKECCQAEGYWGNTPLRVIDTPGLCPYPSVPYVEQLQTLREDVVKPLHIPEESDKAPNCAILLVISLEQRLTQEDLGVYRMLRKEVFGPQMAERTVVVWTHSNVLGKQPEGTSDNSNWRQQRLEDFLHGSPDEFLQLVSSAKGGSVVLDNLEESVQERRAQLRALLQAADAVAGPMPKAKDLGGKRGRRQRQLAARLKEQQEQEEEAKKQAAGIEHVVALTGVAVEEATVEAVEQALEKG